MEWEAQVNTGGLNEWIEHMEQKLTQVRDFLDIMEIEKEQLKQIWKGRAMESWEKEFKALDGRVRVVMEEMKQFLPAVEEAAHALAVQEKSMTVAAEKL